MKRLTYQLEGCKRRGRRLRWFLGRKWSFAAKPFRILAVWVGVVVVERNEL